MSLFEAFWTEALREAMPWAAPFFYMITQLGSANFYVAMVAIGFWTMDKRASRRAALLLLVSSYTNYWFKVSLGNPRPPPPIGSRVPRRPTLASPAATPRLPRPSGDG